MKYNINAHLPQQIENFLNGYTSGELGIIERAFSNIKDIITDENFQKDIKEYEDKLKKRVDGIEKKALGQLRDGGTIKTMGDVMNIITQAQDTLETVNNEFLEAIKGYVVGWTSQMDVTVE